MHDELLTHVETRIRVCASDVETQCDEREIRRMKSVCRVWMFVLAYMFVREEIEQRTRMLQLAKS